MNTLAAADLVTQMRWRYAVKAFDPAKKVPEAAWKALEESLVLSPSSYGLQPWRFLVVDDPAVRAKLRPASWGQSQVTDAARYVVFAAKDGVTEGDVDAFVRRICEVRGVTPESMASYRKMMVGGVVKGMSPEEQRHWGGLQVYIALGTFMTAAAVLGVDACPMEGIEPAKYDEILGLAGTGWHTLCACAAGYRAESDRYALAPKVRFAAADVVRHV
jgi:nitroreductase